MSNNGPGYQFALEWAMQKHMQSLPIDLIRDQPPEFWLSIQIRVMERFLKESMGGIAGESEDGVALGEEKKTR
jgi:hypothetical protein